MTGVSFSMEGIWKHTFGQSIGGLSLGLDHHVVSLIRQETLLHFVSFRIHEAFLS